MKLKIKTFNQFLFQFKQRLLLLYFTQIDWIRSSKILALVVMVIFHTYLFRSVVQRKGPTLVAMATQRWTGLFTVKSEVSAGTSSHLSTV